MKTGYGTVQRAQQAEIALREKTAALQQDRGRPRGRRAQDRRADVGARQGARRSATAACATQHQAELNLSYTSITAPVDGTVGARSLRVGQYVQAGTALMAVVPLKRSMSSPTTRRRSSPTCGPGQKVDDRDRLLPRQGAARPCRQPVAGQRPRIRAAAARQRDRQLHQDRAARPGEDRARRQGADAAGCAPGMSVEPTIDTKAAAPAVRVRTRLVLARYPGVIYERRSRIHAVRHRSPPMSVPLRRQDLDRRDRLDARRLHGDPQHPDRQRLARRHPGRDRRRHRRRRLDLDLLPGGRDRRHPAHRPGSRASSRSAST